ncbi:MAG: glutathione-disulfide reductase [Alphaproteobacteria bacterium]|nr:glutathione-disulfide reductase [Alphaproteobacteria bacterium]
MARYDYDLFTIGAGSGGVRASRLTAMGGARVAVAEEDRIGGTCVIRGCIPKKLFVYASEYAQGFKDAVGFGWTVEWARFDWATLRDNVQAEVSRLSGIYAANLEKAGVETIPDRAEIVGPNTVRLAASGRTLTAERILVATGGAVVRPDIKGAEYAITSNEAFHLERLPERAIVVGGGYIALEFAHVFHGLGVHTTLVHRGQMVLRGFDEDVRGHVQAEMKRSGIDVLTETMITEIAPAGDGYVVKLSNGQVLETGLVMFAIGRMPNTDGLGLEEVGVRRTDVGAIAVDQWSQTSVPSIFAIGDVTNRVNLTPVAIREAVAFHRTVYQGIPTAMDHTQIPTAVFGLPQVGVVGLTETEARIRFGPVDIYKTSFRPMKHILAKNEERMLMKLVVRASDDVVLGVHLAGPDAPEMIQLAAIAVKAGLTKSQWDDTVALHPTAAEELVLLKEKAEPSAAV